MVIKILFLKPKAKFQIFSWIIRAVQKTNYSHIGIFIDHKEILDATINGVKFTKVNDYRNKYEIKKYVVIKHNVENESEIYEWAYQYKNTKYSVIQNIGLGLRYLKILKTNPFGCDDRRIVCSELAALFVNKFSNVEITDSDNYDLIDIERIAEGIKWP